MENTILFTPDNRLLGSATGDFGRYGAQSDPHFSIQQAREEALAEPEHGASKADLPSNSLAAPDAPLAEQAPAGTELIGETGAGSLAPISFLIAAPPISFEPLTAPVQSITPIVSEWHPAPSGAGAPIPVLEQVDTAAPTVAAPEPVQDVITGTAAPLLDHLSAGPDLVTGLVSPLIETVGSVLSTTVGLVDDTLDGLAGGDLLGGVATLVSLVSISDTFDINPLEAPLADSAGDAGLGIVDILVGDLLPDALLGTHHEDGLLGTHDHPLGFGDPA